MKSELKRFYQRAAGMLLMMLLTTTTAWAKDFSGGELYTLQEFQYGKFEARMKMAAASGTVSSMFLYQDGSEIPDGRPWVEVDMEVLGKNPNIFQSNIITGKAGAQVTSEKHHTVSPAADQAFHTYAIEWTPDYVRWTVDGKEVRKTKTGVNDNKNQVANLTGTQGLHFNLWSSESAEWVGAFDESKLPLYQFINWVKVYKYTPGAGDGGSDFTLDWTDNFDTFDGSRWGKGDGTFDGNRVDLTENNIYCRDGMLILALTRKGQENFNGSVPDDVVASGYCGDPEVSSGQNVTWKLTGDGVLTISGTGAMANYDSSSDHPWSAFHSDITTAVIGDGVTSIGRRAFADCANLTSVTLPAGVKELGDDAFEGYNANLIIYVPLDEYENYCNSWPAYADIIQPIGAIPYIAADGTKQYCADFTELTGSETSLPAGNYLATGTLNYTSGITLTGNGTLILADNCHMNVGTSGERINGNGIAHSSGSHSITITSQSLGDNMGHLSVYNTGDGKNGILARALTINGGNVTADTDGKGSHALEADDGTVTINGGTVNATTAGTGAHAINTGNFNYNGGNVTATATGTAAYAIYADGNYTFSWRTPADRITIGATGLYTADDKTATFTRLFTDATNIYSGELTGSAINALAGKTLSPCLALDDATDNSTTITTHAGHTIAVTLSGRTLYKDGAWNTLCLPFGVADGDATDELTFSGTPLEGAIVKVLDVDGYYDGNTRYDDAAEGRKQTGLDGSTLNLYFNTATAIEAGKPYIVKWPKADGYDSATPATRDLKNPVFTSVTINATASTEVSFTGGKFKGIYAPIEWDTENQSILFLGVKGGKSALYYPQPDGGNNPHLNAFRAYFQIGDGTSAAPQLTAINLNFDGETTGVPPPLSPEGEEGASPWGGLVGVWYTLSGTRLDSMPTQKGVYIHNGKKRVIK